MKRALVVSGGGSKGAWAGGLLQYLIDEKKYDWDMYFGTSTGALLITLSSIKEMQRLKNAYLNITNKDIFSINPFGGWFTKPTNINIFNAIYRLFTKKTSLGESANLLKLLERTFTEEDFEKTLITEKKLFPCAVNYSYGIEEYVCNKNVTYNDYIQYTYASTCVPLAMNLVNINGELYLDGGVLQHIPIQKAIELGADEIDVIVLRPERIKLQAWKPSNMLDVMMRTLEIMDTKISDYNVITSSLMAREKDVKLRIRYTPYNLTTDTKDSLFFDKKKMTQWWKEGYEFAKFDNQSKKIFLKAEKGFNNDSITIE